MMLNEHALGECVKEWRGGQILSQIVRTQVS